MRPRREPKVGGGFLLSMSSATMDGEGRAETNRLRERWFIALLLSRGRCEDIINTTGGPYLPTARTDTRYKYIDTSKSRCAGATNEYHGEEGRVLKNEYRRSTKAGTRDQDRGEAYYGVAKIHQTIIQGIECCSGFQLFTVKRSQASQGSSVRALSRS